jgi:DMSO/TMAO reductase YedYZ heme-binding membrane subunit
VSLEDVPSRGVLKELASRIQRIEERLEILEHGSAVGPQPALRASDEEAPERTAWTGGGVLMGRAFLVLGGAFLLRAVTDANLVPLVLGTSIGYVYAIAWLVPAHRAARRGRVEDASFHGLATGIIALPLIWEACVRTELLEPWAGAGALLFTAILGLGTALHGRVPAVAWLTAGAAAPTALGLGFATRALTPFLACLLALGLLTLWAGDRRGWPGLGWAVAAMTNAAFLLLMAVTIVKPHALDIMGIGPDAWLAMLGGFPAVYLGSLAVRTLFQGQPARTLEVGQALTASAVGVAGAMVISPWTHAGPSGVATVMVVLASCSGAAAIGVVRRRQGEGLTFHFYLALGSVLALIGIPVILDPLPATAAFGAIGIAGVWRGWRIGRGVAALHGAAHLVAAAAASSFLTGVLEAFTGPAKAPATWLHLPVIVAAICIGLACATVWPRRHEPWSWAGRVAGGVIALLLVSGVADFMVTLGATLLPKDGGMAAAALPVLRTGMLAAVAVALSALHVGNRWSDLQRLSYGILGIGALKLIMEDLHMGQAATLFASLTLYGGALILVSRMASKGTVATPTAHEAELTTGSGSENGAPDPPRR